MDWISSFVGVVLMAVAASFVILLAVVTLRVGRALHG